MLQGALAVISGQKLETIVENTLLKYFPKHEIKARAKFTNIYNKNGKMDFAVERSGIVIECKRQKVCGTVDQKIPFVLANLEKVKANLGILMLDGDWYRQQTGLVEWAKNKALALRPLNIQILFPEELDTVLNEFCQTKRITK